MPKQNRPLVRDGRIQGRKKRTDRSYLRPNGATGVDAPADDAEVTEDQVEEAAEAPTTEASAPEPVVVEEPAPVAESTAIPPVQLNGTSVATNGTAAPARLSGSARALQQQGVRKRREFDVNALAMRDSKYAIHELRRIFILATMVVITLIVLAFVLRWH